jgi:translation initiation factor IF-2
VPSFGLIAGSYVTEGKITRNVLARVVRDHVVVHTGKVTSLRRFKEDAREVQSGYECGIGLENYTDLKTGDVIEAFETEQVARRLTPSSGKSVGAERRV